MADNVIANAGSGGSTFAADEILSVLYPRTKLIHGADGVNAGDVSTANPLPSSPRTPNGDSVCDDANDAVKIVQATASLLNCTEASAAGILTTLQTISAAEVLVVASLSVLDDWDETDRCKVNLIVGQAGISAGAGAVGVTTPRVTLASDDPAVASLAAMDDWDEADRAKVNLVVGQAGITAGAGAVAANTPRATLASDDPAVVSLAIVDDWDETDRCKVNVIAGQVGVAGNTGTVGATTQRVTLATDVGLPAGTALMGKVSAGHDTTNIYDGVTALVPKFAKISAAASGDNTLVGLVASKKIRVLAIAMFTTGTVNAYFTSGAGGTAIFADSTNKIQLSGSTIAGFVLPFNPAGWFESAAGVLLNLVLSGAVGVAGGLLYVEV